MKLALIGLGLINVALFEYFTARKADDLASLTPLPAAAPRWRGLDCTVDRGRDLRAEDCVFLTRLDAGE